MAKEGDKEGCKILAKQLVQLRNQKTRLYSANSKVGIFMTYVKDNLIIYSIQIITF